MRAGFPLGALLPSGWGADLVRVEPCVQDRLDDRAGASCLLVSVGVDWASGPGGSGKRVRLNRKNPAHFCE